ncbi:hypothetical protein [Rhizobium sp. Leaf262]|uniref:hypothetical protein n=1 Tax=Rhizobium sp. Leaf262 TaxID=1736312 RepID=UPI0007131D2C|nr:hypothetical protein [Rhizobium sp. Leaf262]KQO82229.1 hypothetical protein ASF29_16935 [Rhizobium sp. Leaf262]
MKVETSRGEQPPDASIRNSCIEYGSATGEEQGQSVPQTQIVEKIFAGKKRGPPDHSRALVSVKVKNLQRGTADAAELGGKAAVCISYVRYDAFLGSIQLFFVQASPALGASLLLPVIFISQISDLSSHGESSLSAIKCL